MKLKDLIGYQLVQVDDSKIIVKGYGGTFVLNIEEDEGDCCGYNEIETHLLIDNDEIKKNPIITNIEYLYSGNDESDIVKITFYGNDKKLANIESLSSSGSGWNYGACVTVTCKELNINEKITEW